MLALRNPHEAYRRVDFDARVTSATPAQLVTLCYEQLISALGSALVAHERQDNLLKSQSLTRAISSLTALHMGVDSSSPIGGALLQLYEGARRSVLDNVLEFDVKSVTTIRQDFIDISRAMAASSGSG